MPKNTKGGKKHKRGKKRAPQSLPLKDENTSYAKVLSNLGNGLVHLQLISSRGDEGTCLGHIRGKVVRLRWNKGDIVLVGFRQLTKEVDDSKRVEVDINYKYFPDHVQQLIDMGEIKRQDDYTGFDGSDDIEFDYNYESESDSDDDETETNESRHVRVDYSNPMPYYESEEYEESEEEVEYDKLGNTIVKPKVKSSTVTSNVEQVIGTGKDSDSDSDKAAVTFERPLTAPERKKLESLGNNSQAKKMEKKLQRKKKNTANAELLDTEFGEINIDDI
jgi:translation initiation factor IF-1